jgi:hypothetical protein
MLRSSAWASRCAPFAPRKWTCVSPLNQRARLNGAVYFTDYTNLQVNTPISPGVVDIRNAATALTRIVVFVGGVMKWWGSG